MSGGRFDWERALRDSDLPWPTKSMCLLLATWMDAETGATFVSVSTLASASGLARSNVLRHLGLATEAGWLVSVQQAGKKTHRIANVPPDPSYQQDGSGARPVLPAGPDPSYQQDPTRPTSRTGPVLPAGPDQVLITQRSTHHQELAAVDSESADAADSPSVDGGGDFVIIHPEDRAPHSDDGVFDACRAAGAPWTLGDVIAARRKLTAALGDDARAAGAADAALKELAARRPVIRTLGAFLTAKARQPGGLESLRVATGSLKSRPPVLGCSVCSESAAGAGFLGDPDSPRPCDCRRAAQKARAS